MSRLRQYLEERYCGYAAIPILFLMIETDISKNDMRAVKRIAAEECDRRYCPDNIDPELFFDLVEMLLEDGG